MADAYMPKKEDKFSFGLWTVGNPGRDPFGDPTRKRLSPTRIVQKLSKLGAWGINLHDNDLVPIDATRQQRNKIVRDRILRADRKPPCPQTSATHQQSFVTCFKTPALQHGQPTFPCNLPIKSRRR